VYDLYGHEGLRAGLQVGPLLKTREEIRAEFEALKASRDARAAEARVNYRGHYMFGAAAASPLGQRHHAKAHLERVF
jgi:hypothetical protein